MSDPKPVQIPKGVDPWKWLAGLFEKDTEMHGGPEVVVSDHELEVTVLWEIEAKPEGER